MAYAQYGTITATDFNTLVGANPGSTINVLNTTWATGAAAAGYGQTAEANVTSGGSVAASSWANLVNKTANAATHQGSSITAVTAPVVGGTVTYLSSIPTNLTTIYTNRLNASSQSSTTSNARATTTTWTSNAIFVHTATFANGDAARYFFNSGGQLAITVSHANTTAGINLLLNQLCTNVGTVVMSSVTSGTATIAGTSYNGVTKIGGGGTTPVIGTNRGYYSWTTANANAFYQTASTGPSGYLATNINIFVRTNGTVGSNGDVGNVITITTVWDEIPNGLTVGIGSTTTLTVRPPEVTNLANTWGTITLASSVTDT
jgi:hypothetical protein